MDFGVYKFWTQSSPVPNGGLIVLAYAAGDTRFSFDAAGEHYAIGPFNQLITEPEAFTVSFDADAIRVTWNATAVPIGKQVTFQFAKVQHPTIDGQEVALASLANVTAASAFGKGILFAANAAAAGLASPADITAAVSAAVAGLVNSSPAALDTLNELAAAIGNDANFAATMTTALAAKAPLASPTFSGNFTVRDQFILDADFNPPQLTANVSNYNPTGLATSAVMRLTTDAPRTIGGIAGASAGRVLVIQNAGTNLLTLLHEDVGSTGANRMDLGQLPHRIEPGRSTALIYDGVGLRWRLLFPMVLAAIADIYAGTDTERPITPGQLYGALAMGSLFRNASNNIVTGSTGGTTLNFAQFINAAITLDANSTLLFPINPKVGQCGIIEVTQDATGSRTLSFAAGWKRDGGAPTLSTAAGAKDYIVYHVISASLVVYALLKAPS
jgi:hypothetical protein